MTEDMTRLAVCIRMLCVLGLVLFGFSHRPPALEAPFSAIAYTLPDGTVTQLCLSSDTGPASDHHHKASGTCEACRLSTSILPTPPQCVMRTDAALVAKGPPHPQGAAEAQRHLRPGAGPRAPPQPSSFFTS